LGSNKTDCEGKDGRRGHVIRLPTGGSLGGQIEVGAHVSGNAGDFVWFSKRTSLRLNIQKLASECKSLTPSQTFSQTHAYTYDTHAQINTIMSAVVESQKREAQLDNAFSLLEIRDGQPLEFEQRPSELKTETEVPEPCVSFRCQLLVCRYRCYQRIFFLSTLIHLLPTHFFLPASRRRLPREKLTRPNAR